MSFFNFSIYGNNLTIVKFFFVTSYLFNYNKASIVLLCFLIFSFKFVIFLLFFDLYYSHIYESEQFYDLTESIQAS